MELRDRAPRPARSWLVIRLALLILAPSASAQNSFAFLQPVSNPVQCQTYAFAWTGGTPTYKLQVSVNNGSWGKAYGISGLGGPGFPWTIPVPAGYSVNFELFDNASHVTSAGPLTIQPSDDTSCLDSPAPRPFNNSTTTTSSTSTTTSSTTTSSTTTTSTTTTSSAEAPTTTSQTSTPSTSTSSSTTTSSPSSVTPSLTSFTASPSQSLTTTSGARSTPVIETITAVPTTTSQSNASPTPRRATLSTGAIVGIAVGGVAILVLAGVMIWFCRKREGPRSFGAGTTAMGLDTSTDSDATSRLRSGEPQMSEAMRSEHRLGPHLVPAPSSSSSASDPFASSDDDGSRQLLLPTGREDYVPASFRGQQDGTAAHSRNLSLPSESSAPLPIGIHDHSPAVDDSMPKPSVADDTPAITSLHALGVNAKLESESPPRDLPVRPSSHPPRGPERIGIAQSYAAVPTDERSAASRVGAPAHLMRFEEDGGVRLAGGLAGEVLDEDGDDSGGWVVQPPPYQRFR